MKQQIILNAIVVLLTVLNSTSISAQDDELRIKSTVDFELTGSGSSSNWNKAKWVE